MTTPNIPPWVRAVAYGDGTHQASHKGNNVSYMGHAIALRPGEGFPDAGPGPVKYIRLMLDDGGPWNALPRSAVAAWQAAVADESYAVDQYMEEEGTYGYDPENGPPPQNPVYCTLLGSVFLSENLRRFVNALPAEEVEWKVVPAPNRDDGGTLLIARMGGLRAAIMSARMQPEGTYAPSFESSEFAP